MSLQNKPNLEQVNSVRNLLKKRECVNNILDLQHHMKVAIIRGEYTDAILSLERLEQAQLDLESVYLS